MTAKPKLLLVGAGGHARSCIDVIEQQNVFSIAGLVGSTSEVGTRVMGYEVLGTDDELPKFLESIQLMIVTIGGIGTGKTRQELFARALDLGFHSPPIVSPLAYVSKHARVGRGTVVMHHAFINAGSVIGENCIINTSSLIEHDAVINDNCHIATGVIINGGATLGRSTFVGSGTVIRENVIVGTNCVVGMGLSLRENLMSHSRYYGQEVSLE